MNKRELTESLSVLTSELDFYSGLLNALISHLKLEPIRKSVKEHWEFRKRK